LVPPAGAGDLSFSPDILPSLTHDYGKFLIFSLQGWSGWADWVLGPFQPWCSILSGWMISRITGDVIPNLLQNRWTRFPCLSTHLLSTNVLQNRVA
jgi:hypothetical protein